LTHFTFLL